MQRNLFLYICVHQISPLSKIIFSQILVGFDGNPNIGLQLSKLPTFQPPISKVFFRPSSCKSYMSMLKIEHWAQMISYNSKKQLFKLHSYYEPH